MIFLLPLSTSWHDDPLDIGDGEMLWFDWVKPLHHLRKRQVSVLDNLSMVGAKYSQFLAIWIICLLGLIFIFQAHLLLILSEAA